jgi:hypothetical protein
VNERQAGENRERRGVPWGKLIASGLLILAIGFGFLATQVAGSAARAPVWQGHTLSFWMRRGGPQYVAAMNALGTNALPWLLQELQARNSLPSRLGEKLFSRWIDINWDAAGYRRYLAQIALQYLDTNAAPALLDAVFARPMIVGVGELGSEAAFALTRLSTPASERIKEARLNQAVHSPDREHRRSACLVFAMGNKPTADQMVVVSGLAHDTDVRVRAAAMRVLFWQHNEAAAVPALLAGLQDPHPAVRLLASQAIEQRGTNAASLVPALQAAYAREPSLPRATNEADFLYRGDQTLSSTSLCSAIAWAIRQIDPAATIPK